jgi:hypothetical protein
MSEDIPKALDRKCAAVARSMHQDLGRGLITVIDGKIVEVEREMAEEHLEGELRDLFLTMIRVYNPQKEYVLIVKENGKFKYFGTRSL